MIGWMMGALALGATVYMIRRKVNIGLIMLFDAACLAIGARLPIGEIGRAALTGAADEGTLLLLAILILIMMLEHIMREKGMIRSLVDAVLDLTGNSRTAALALPSVLGLLPSPGGARFSCPMVEGAMGTQGTGEERAYVNYWYRHVWMDSFVLYPGVILVASLLGMRVISLFLWMLPYMVIHALSGYFLVLRRMPAQPIPRKRTKREAGKALLRAGAPILFLIAVYMGFLPFTDCALQIAGLLTVAGTFLYGRCSRSEIWSAIKAGFSLKYIIMIVGIMVFREMLSASGLTGDLVDWIGARGISPRWLYAFLPLMAGFGSGIAVSMISLSFPVLIPLGLSADIPWVVAAAFAIGAAGDMLTPLHICGVVSTEYFNADMSKVYAKVALSELPIVIAAAAVLIFL